jgi:hypothetical protein
MVTEKIKKKIHGLINRGMNEMAFSKKENAEYFKRQMRKRGMTIGTLRSSGPTVENPRKRKYHAYYVVAKKHPLRFI